MRARNSSEIDPTPVVPAPQDTYYIPPPSYFPSTSDLEHDSQSTPLDLNCYCRQCQTFRQSYPKLRRNLIHGSLYFPLLLLWNITSGLQWYLRDLRLKEEEHDGIVFSESVLWDQQRVRDQVALVNIDKLSEILNQETYVHITGDENTCDNNLVYGVLFYHYSTRKSFYRVFGWSAMWLSVWLLICGLCLSIALGGETWQGIVD